MRDSFSFVCVVMPPKLRVSQEAFDAAVQENIDEFGMEPEEALSVSHPEVFS